MSQFQADSAMGLNQDIDVNSTTLQDTLGRTITATDTASTAYGEGEFIYLQGVASTAVGSVVTYQYGDYVTALASANGVGLVAVAMSACVAGEYGWYQIRGLSVMKVLASFAADKLVYLTSTAGSVDDAVVVGDAIQPSYSFTAIDTPSTGLAEVSIDHPFVSNISN